MPPRAAARGRKPNAPPTRSRRGAESPDHSPARATRSQSKHDKSSSKGALKPAPKAPKAPKPKTASRRKHEHSVPPVELAAAVESEDEDDTEAQEDDEPDELGEEDKGYFFFYMKIILLMFQLQSTGSAQRASPRTRSVTSHPRIPRSSPSSPPNSLWRRTAPVVRKVCLSRPCLPRSR
jgi:hypothetical protein